VTVNFRGHVYTCILEEKQPFDKWHARLDRVARTMASETDGVVGRSNFVGWVRNDLKTVEARFHHHAKHGIAYAIQTDYNPRMKVTFVSQFFEKFLSDVDVWVNFGDVKGNSYSWDSFSNHTFDVAIGILDYERSGILCIIDED